MARAAARLDENASGDFFVDDACIDCETCRHIAPSLFARQPQSDAERLRAKMALVSCPTSAIGSVGKADVREAVDAFPEPIEGGVHYCGFAAEGSYGASSYLILRPDGNVLVDSPRA